MALKVCGIYTIRHVASGKCYVGQSADIEKRFRKHKSDLGRNAHRSKHFQSAWNKHGSESFEICVLEIVPCCENKQETIHNLTIAEQKWIDALRPAYNVAPAAGSNLGIKFTIEHCEKISFAKRGYNHTPEARAKIGASKRGRQLTAEHKAKISAAGRGRKPTPEATAKSVAARLGTKRSLETRLKMSLAHKGNPSPKKGRKFTQKEKDKMRVRQTGWKLSEETRARMRVAIRKPFTEEHRANMRAAWITRKAARLADKD